MMSSQAKFLEIFLKPINPKRATEEISRCFPGKWLDIEKWNEYLTKVEVLKQNFLLKSRKGSIILLYNKTLSDDLRGFPNYLLLSIQCLLFNPLR